MVERDRRYARERAAQVAKEEDVHKEHQQSASDYIHQVVSKRRQMGRTIIPLEHTQEDILRPTAFRKITGNGQRSF